jgi:hypothetical protein
VVADRAYDIAPFVDRLHARGWHWVLRAKAASDLRFRDARAGARPAGPGAAAPAGARGPLAGARAGVQESGLAGGQRGRRVGARHPGAAGGAHGPAPAVGGAAAVRPALLDRAGVPHGQDARPAVGEQPGEGVAHHARLLLAMAWASLRMLCLGVTEAQRRLARLTQRRPRRGRRGRPRPARQSVFTLGLRLVGPWLHGTARRPWSWRLPELDSASWLHRWYQAQALRIIFGETVCPWTLRGEGIWWGAL